MSSLIYGEKKIINYTIKIVQGTHWANSVFINSRVGVQSTSK